MKLVINRCYGGFGLSPKAVKRLAELQGKPCYFFKHQYRQVPEYVPLSIDEIEDGMFFNAFSVPDPSSAFTFGKAWHAMTPEQKEAENKKYSDASLNSFSDMDRSDPLLIQVVEELGEEANGPCAKLKIVEIPDGTRWEIDEYDGMERVDEVHNSWS